MTELHSLSTRDGRSRPRPGLSAQKRKILDAAVRLFQAHGTEAVSIAEICAAAEVSRPTFYRAFPDKDALLAEIYDLSVLEPVQWYALRGLGAAIDDPELLYARLDQMCDAIFVRAEFAALLFAESGRPDSPAAALIDQTFERLAEALTQAELPVPIPSVAVLKASMAACQWLIHDAIRRGATPQARQNAKAAVREFVTRMLYGPEPRPTTLPQDKGESL
ncbi:MAG: TetR/AcrR family transcriptional regulator [Candidatus Dadabacteria bacterium]|nr:MAG: TetR/AcrR family transcriptional regulator [Candidatus Dadabacteria bacterium]